MPVRDRSIGNQGLEQAGPNMGNDYSRNITRETQANDVDNDIVARKDKDKNKDKNKKTKASTTSRSTKK